MSKMNDAGDRGIVPNIPAEKEQMTLNEKSECVVIKAVLKNLMTTFSKTEKEIAIIYASVNGIVEDCRKVLEGKQVVAWDKLEDLALAMPEGSPQFEILL